MKGCKMRAPNHNDVKKESDLQKDPVQVDPNSPNDRKKRFVKDSSDENSD